MAAEEAEAEADAAVDLHALERDVGGLALDDAGDLEDDDAGSFVPPTTRRHPRMRS